MSISLHTSPQIPHDASTDGLPTVLNTPSGLALLEIQGTLNFPQQPATDETSSLETPTDDRSTSRETPIGRLVFPEFDARNPSDGQWMKRVYLYVGKHQRLTGQVKKLPNAMAVIRKRATTIAPGSETENDVLTDGSEGEQTDLEIVDIIKYKVLFSSRPEPVGHVVDEG